AGADARLTIRAGALEAFDAGAVRLEHSAGDGRSRAQPSGAGRQAHRSRLARKARRVRAAVRTALWRRAGSSARALRIDDRSGALSCERPNGYQSLETARREPRRAPPEDARRQSGTDR